MARPNKDGVIVKSLSPNELAELIAISVKKTKPSFTTEMAKLCMKTFIEIMADEIKNNGYFNIPNIGTFKISTCGGTVKRVYNIHTKQKNNVMIPLTYMVRFKTSEYLKGYLNNLEPSLKVKNKSAAKAKEAVKPEFQREVMIEKQKRARKQKRLAELLEPDYVEFVEKKKDK
jgi:nucleoid DNA-binding protein